MSGSKISSASIYVFVLTFIFNLSHLELVYFCQKLCSILYPLAVDSSAGAKPKISASCPHLESANVSGRKQLQGIDSSSLRVSPSLEFQSFGFLIVSLPLCRLQKDDFCILSGFSGCSLQKHWFTTNYSLSLGSGNNPFSFLNMLKSLPLKTHQTLH